ncbi:hypothetical protein CCE02nite_29380 [Cellulosimicrobium cellulans]|uniref:Uncharacterized protein n=1 Tax=Cellulosimicrobium cellulans TaxID=1710 RepID=A0A4Y4DZS9_CELCE|nr:hypothetical protein CCE02nite_29380 [Cellulosimicrobium cellulans]
MRVAGRRAPDDAAAFAPVVELFPVVGRARDMPEDAAGLDVDERDDAPDAVGPDRAGFDPDDPRAGPVAGRAGAPGRGGRREDGMPRLCCRGGPGSGSTRGASANVSRSTRHLHPRP